MDKYLAHEINELHRLREQALMISICDTTGVLLAISKCNAKSMGAIPEQLIGLNLVNPTTEQIQLLMPAVSAQEMALIQDGFAVLKKLLDILILEKIAISYIDFTPYGGIRQPYLVTALPIFGEDVNIVVGVKIVATEYSLYGQNDYFKELSRISHKKDSNQPDNKKNQIIANNKINLAERQLEIVYLLTNNFTQSEVAQILNISRGTIASIVSEQICPKFNIAGSSTKILIEKAINLGLNKVMPIGLYKPFIIILNSEISERYF